MARPRILDPDKRDQICTSISIGLSLRTAADLAGCCERTVRREQARDAQFRLALRDAKQSAARDPWIAQSRRLARRLGAAPKTPRETPDYLHMTASYVRAKAVLMGPEADTIGPKSDRIGPKTDAMDDEKDKQRRWIAGELRKCLRIIQARHANRWPR